MDINPEDIIYVSITTIVLLICSVRILGRAGHSAYWSPLVLVPIVNIIVIWMFAFSIWPKYESNHKLAVDSKSLAQHKIFAPVVTLILGLLVGGVYYGLHSLNDLFEGFEGNLPLITKILIEYNKYLILIPIAGLFISIDIMRRNQISIAYRNATLGTLLGLLTVTILSLPVILWASYAPIYELGKTI